MKNEYLEELIEEYPLNVRRAMRAAFDAADSKHDPQEDLRTIADIGATVAAGLHPSPLAIVQLVGAGISLARWSIKKRKRRNAKRRRAGMAAGMAAANSMRKTYEMMRRRRK